MNPPKYARDEIERRWLVRPEALPALDTLPCRWIDDLYLSGTRLRLRRVQAPGSEPVYKLGKKYGKQSPWCEAVSTLYLSEPEYLALQALPGHAIRKQRFDWGGGALDVYPEAEGVVIFEMEFASEAEAAAFAPPAFVAEEISGDAASSGAALARRCAEAAPAHFTRSP